MSTFTAPGLPSDWLNAWLAAVGTTVIVPGLRLGWTQEPTPKAQFAITTNTSLAKLITAHMPGIEELDELVIATLDQNLDQDQYQLAAQKARQRRDPSLSILTTDLAKPTKNETLPTGFFNVGAPRGETLHNRLRACRTALDTAEKTLESLVTDTLEGRGMRIKANGLGFDYHRITAPVPGEATKMVDPLIECLCFFGLLLHPVSGDGNNLLQRGWISRTFAWPTWTPALDRWAIDALLDHTHLTLTNQSAAPPDISPPLQRLGITALYQSIPFQRTGSSDTTRGYASQQVSRRFPTDNPPPSIRLMNPH